MEAQAHLRACVGCAAMVPDIDGPTHRYIGASPGCWALYGELAEKEAGDFRYMRSHRLTVDAYCAQHPGGALPAGGALGSGAPRRPALPAGAPAGARSARREVVRRSPAGCDARQARYKLGPRWLEVPASLGAVTVLDLLAVAAKDPAEHARGARGWAESVWEAWMAHQEVVRRWAAHPAR